MRFLQNQKVQVVFHTAKLKRDREGGRAAVLRFKLKLNGTTARSTPKFVQQAYQAAKDALDQGKLHLDIEHQTVEFYRLPDNKRANIKFDDLTLGNLSMERIEDGGVQLVFTFGIDVNKASGEWIMESYGTEVWAEFSETQKELWRDEDEEEEEGDEEEAAQGELVAEPVN